MKSKKRISILVVVALIVTTFLFQTNVQAVTVQEQYINQNRSYQTLNATGLVIHDTDAEGGTAQNNRDYFNRVYSASSAHYFVDWSTVIQTVPESEVAWHAGPTANHRYLSIEMCMPYGNNQAQFNATYKKTVELAADICKRHGWSSNDIHSHYWVSYNFHETDHEDPIEFLQSYGKSWDIFLQDIQNAINGQTISVTSSSKSQINNNDIATLQKELNSQALGDLEVDSIAGPKTLGACPLLKIGSRGNITKWVQAKLGITADGIFGNQTRRAIIDFQIKNGLYSDGIIGQYTWSKLLGL